jgi:hypothetical protein
VPEHGSSSAKDGNGVWEDSCLLGSFKYTLRHLEAGQVLDHRQAVGSLAWIRNYNNRCSCPGDKGVRHRGAPKRIRGQSLTIDIMNVKREIRRKCEPSSSPGSRGIRDRIFTFHKCVDELGLIRGRSFFSHFGLNETSQRRGSATVTDLSKISFRKR